jgi:hypothetical protein
LEIVNESIHKLSARFKSALEGKAAPEYVTSVLAGFASQYTLDHPNSKAKDYFMAKESVFSDILNLLWKYENTLLDIEDSGEDWRAVNRLILQVTQVVNWLDDLRCEAMDPDILLDKFYGEKFEFQN